MSKCLQLCSSDILTMTDLDEVSTVLHYNTQNNRILINMKFYHWFQDSFNILYRSSQYTRILSIKIEFKLYLKYRSTSIKGQ